MNMARKSLACLATAFALAAGYLHHDHAQKEQENLAKKNSVIWVHREVETCKVKTLKLDEALGHFNEQSLPLQELGNDFMAGFDKVVERGCLQGLQEPMTQSDYDAMNEEMIKLYGPAVFN